MTRDEKLTAKFMFMACGNLQAVVEATQLPDKDLRRIAQHEGWMTQFKNLASKIDPLLRQSVARRIERAREKHINFVIDTLEENEFEMRNMVPSLELDALVSPERKINLLDKHDQIARRTLGLDKQKEDDPVMECFKYLVASQRAKPLNSVNEVEGVLTDDDFITGVVEEAVVSEKVEPYNIHNGSAVLPLPEETNATTGILGAFNGHSNGSYEENEVVEKDIPDRLWP
jgi:hypothetical protein